MKKFMKICCITAAAMLVVGFVMTTISITLGAPAQLVAMAKEGAFTINGINLAGDDFDYQLHFDQDGDPHFNSAFETYSGSIDDMKIVEGKDISALDISIICGKLTIKPSSDSYIGIHSENADTFQYYSQNGTFYLKGFKKKISSFKNDITLYLPKDMKFNNVDLSVGGGDVDLDSICAETITLDIGAGDLDCENLVAESLSIDVGAGDCDIKNSTIANADFSVGMGDTDFEGVITNDLNLECSMGKSSFQFTDSYTDHNYDLSCALGSVEIADRSYDNIADDSYIDNDADSTYDIECSMGDVTLKFAK